MPLAGLSVSLTCCETCLILMKAPLAGERLSRSPRPYDPQVQAISIQVGDTEHAFFALYIALMDPAIDIEEDIPSVSYNVDLDVFDHR